MDSHWMTTEHPAIVFEDNTVGRLKKEVWDASEKDIEAILKEYDIPSPSRGREGPVFSRTLYAEKSLRKNRAGGYVFLCLSGLEAEPWSSGIR